MTNPTCKKCGGAGLIWRTVKTKFGGKTVSASIQEWCPVCNAPRAQAETKRKKGKATKR